LEDNEEKAGKDLLKLYEELASLQAHMAIAASRLSRIRKTKNKVKATTCCGLQTTERPYC